MEQLLYTCLGICLNAGGRGPATSVHMSQAYVLNTGGRGRTASSPCARRSKWHWSRGSRRAASGRSSTSWCVPSATPKPCAQRSCRPESDRAPGRSRGPFVAMWTTLGRCEPIADPSAHGRMHRMACACRSLTQSPCNVATCAIRPLVQCGHLCNMTTCAIWSPVQLGHP